MKRFMMWGLALMTLAACSSSSDEPVNGGEEPPLLSDETLYVVNSGSFNYSNSSLTVWSPDYGARNEAFFRANGFKLGDVAQSATLYGDNLWVVVNNSNVIFALDKKTCKEVGRIDKNLVSPRYIHFVSEQKAYVSQMYSSKIAVVDPRIFTVTGYIDVPDGTIPESSGSTEEIVQIGDYVYVNLWSYDNRILKIDTKTDKVVDSLTVGIQPNSLVVDKNFDLWTICDGGGWENNPAGYEAPSLVCINVMDMKVKNTMSLMLNDGVSKLSIDGSRTRLYWSNNRYNSEGENIGGVYSMDISRSALPEIPTVAANGKKFYSLTVSPLNEEIFAADALDYMQNGVIYRYNSDGDLIGQFEAGVIPTAYAWGIE